MATVFSTWRLARTIASRVAQSADIADLARELCGQPLTVYLDGLPADRRADMLNDYTYRIYDNATYAWRQLEEKYWQLFGMGF
jgi:hypothetical protein